LNYGERLKELRLGRDLKQSDLAAMLGVAASTIGSYERCERQPTFELLNKYAKLFNVSIDYMLCNSDEKLTVEQYQQLTTLDLSDTLYKHSITLAGVELTAEDKRRVIDVVTVLLFDKLS
jgi:transcriptional regulator with XRE-family HTH domain